MAELGAIEYGHIKMSTPLQEVSQKIPSEVLSLITGSKRVFKTIGSSIVQERGTPLSWTELSYSSIYPRVLSTDEVYYLYAMEHDVGHEWSITTSSPFILEYISARYIPAGGSYYEMHIELTGTETAYQYSIYDYIRAYNARGEDGIKEVIGILINMRDEYTNVEQELCSSIVALCQDIRL
jgi:hypothetical protein